MIKKCSKCELEKSFEFFCKDSKSKDGRQSQCKSCKSKQISAYYKTDLGKIALKNKPKRERDRRAYKLAYYHANKLVMNMSRQVRRSLNGKKNKCSWQKLVGYSLEELRSHLEKKFREGMCWKNYGFAWHIDHIRPISSFKILSCDCEDFKKCWSLDNLQPLFVEENLRKSNFYCLA